MLLLPVIRQHPYICLEWRELPTCFRVADVTSDYWNLYLSIYH